MIAIKEAIFQKLSSIFQEVEKRIGEWTCFKCGENMARHYRRFGEETIYGTLAEFRENERVGDLARVQLWCANCERYVKTKGIMVMEEVGWKKKNGLGKQIMERLQIKKNGDGNE